MGILSGLFSDYQFDPQSYRVDDPNAPYRGGILGMLNLPTQPPQGFPPLASSSAAAPSIASPQLAQSVAAPAPMAGGAVGREADQQSPSPSPFGGIGNAIGGGIAGLFGQATPGAPQGPTLLDRLTAGANNLTTGGNPIAGIFNAVNGLATGQRTDRAGAELAQQQATMQALTNAGVDPAVARAAATNPDYLKALVATRYGARSATQPAAAVARAGADPSAGAQARRPQQIGGSATPPPRQPTNVASRVDPARPLLRVATPTEAGRLPRGTRFLDPQNVERVVP